VVHQTGQGIFVTLVTFMFQLETNYLDIMGVQEQRKNEETN
jgi:hypothetical protein